MLGRSVSVTKDPFDHGVRDTLGVVAGTVLDKWDLICDEAAARDHPSEKVGRRGPCELTEVAVQVGLVVVAGIVSDICPTSGVLLEPATDVLETQQPSQSSLASDRPACGTRQAGSADCNPARSSAFRSVRALRSHADEQPRVPTTGLGCGPCSTRSSKNASTMSKRRSQLEASRSRSARSRPGAPNRSSSATTAPASSCIGRPSTV